MYRVSCIVYRVSCIVYRVSCIVYRVSCIVCRDTSVQRNIVPALLSTRQNYVVTVKEVNHSSLTSGITEIHLGTLGIFVSHLGFL